MTFCLFDSDLDSGLDFLVHLDKGNCCTQPQKVSFKMITLFSSKYISVFEDGTE